MRKGDAEVRGALTRMARGWEETADFDRALAEYAKAYSADDRKKLASEGKALADGSYPIADAEDLNNALRLARSGHGNVSGAMALIRRRAKELGVKLAEKAAADPLDTAVRVAIERAIAAQEKDADSPLDKKILALLKQALAMQAKDDAEEVAQGIMAQLCEACEGRGRVAGSASCQDCGGTGYMSGGGTGSGGGGSGSGGTGNQMPN